MTTRVPPSIFLERRSYRLRRLMDALRLLPVLGGMLWMLPLFWPAAESGQEAVAASTAITYVFGVWLFLICASLCLSLLLRDRLKAEQATESGEA